MTHPSLIATAVRRALALRNVSFLRAVGVLVTGTALSQLISLAITPILTRLYVPADFDVLSVFVGVTIISSLGACLGFDFALPVAKNERDAINLLVCALLGVVASTVAIAILASVILGSGLLPTQRVRELAMLRWLAPASTMLIGASNAFEYWATRHKRFGTISTSRLVQVTVGGGVQIAGGIAGFGTAALLTGYALLNGLAIVTLAASFLRRDRTLLSQVGRGEIARVASDYRSFLRYTSVEAVANACSVYLPLIIISTAMAGAQAGYLLLAIRLVQAPLQLVGRSVSQVYQSRLAALREEGMLGDTTVRLFRMLLALAVPPFVTVAVLAPDLATVFLGPDYREVGVYIQMITPWVLLHFASAAILPTMYALKRNAQIMVLTVAGLAFRAGAVASAVAWFPDLAPAVYAASGAIFYGVSAVVFLRANGVAADRISRRSLPFWLAVGAALAAAEGLRRLLLLVFA